LWTFAAFQGATMFCFGLVGVNFNAMAMEPLGWIAGTGSSLLGSVTTIGGALIGFYIGQQFDGTVVPLTVGFVAFGLTSLIIIMNAADSSPIDGGTLRRVSSPPGTFSTLITSAPMSASIKVQVCPAMMCVRSMTLSPASAVMSRPPFPLRSRRSGSHSARPK
jgi:hypothetical protein